MEFFSRVGIDCSLIIIIVLWVLVVVSLLEDPKEGRRESEG